MQKQIVIFTILIVLSLSLDCTAPNKLADVFSAGTDDGNKVMIKLAEELILNFDSQDGTNMGLHLVVFDKTTLAKKDQKHYRLATNGLGETAENTRLKNDIAAIAANDYVLIGIKGGAQLMNQEGIDALKTLGANNWPELNVARINFALIGQKGKAAGTALFGHQFRYSGPVSIQACLVPVQSETGQLQPVCQPGTYFGESQCKTCTTNCAVCVNADICQTCKDGFIQLNSKLCEPQTLYSCPNDYALLNFKCIEYQCLAELENLTKEYLAGTCTSTGEAGQQEYHVKIASNQFKMQRNCYYTQNVYRIDKQLQQEPVDRAVTISDQESTIEFKYTLAQVLDKCPVDDSGTNIKYTCDFVVGIAVAGVEQSDIFYTINVEIQRETKAHIGVSIVKNEIKLCGGAACTFYVSVPSKLQSCDANYQCSDSMPTNFKRNDHMYLKHMINDSVLNQFWLVPVIVQLIGTGTDIKIKDYVYDNEAAGQILYDIKFPLAVGQVTLNVQSMVSRTKPTLLMLRRVLQTSQKQEVIETNVAVNISDDGTTVEEEEVKKDGEWAGWKTAVIVVVLGVAAISVAGFFGYRYFKKKRSANYQQEQGKEQNNQE